MRVRLHGWRKWAALLRTPLGVAVVAGAVVLAVGVWNARPMYQAAKVWRVQKLVAQSEEAFRRGDGTTETRLLAEAVNLLPAHSVTWRARAQHHERRAESSALLAYLQLLGTKAATIDDAERASRLATLRGSPETCRKFLELAERIPNASQRPAVIALRAKVLANENSLSEALADAERAVALDGNEGTAKLLLANILMRSAIRAEPAEQAVAAQRAVNLLHELTARTDATAVEALQVLLTLSTSTSAPHALAGYDVGSWISAAEQHPTGGTRLRTAAWNAELATKRGNEQTFFSAFVEKWREAPLADRLEAARWLNQSGHPEFALELASPQKDVSEDWFILHLDALAATRQWTAVLEALNAESGQATELPTALRTLFRLKARAELGEPVDADEDWREIQAQVLTAPARTQIFIAQYAEKTGEQKHAAAIYRRVLKNSSATSALNSSLGREAKLACYTGVLRCTPPTASVTEILPIIEGLASDFPELEDPRNDAIYLRLLSGQTDERTRDDVAKMSKSPSRRLATCTTAALLELRMGNAAAADEVYREANVDWGVAPDSFKAVRAAVLTAAGKIAESDSLRAAIREQKLRPEELQLLHPPPVVPPSEAPYDESSPARSTREENSAPVAGAPPSPL